MRFLVYAQLPFAVCRWLEVRGHEAFHVAKVIGGQTPDVRIAAYAEANELVLISKDEDFVFRYPPVHYRLVWLRCGNVTNRGLSVWLEVRWLETEARLRSGERLVEVR